MLVSSDDFNFWRKFYWVAERSIPGMWYCLIWAGVLAGIVVALSLCCCGPTWSKFGWPIDVLSLERGDSNCDGSWVYILASSRSSSFLNSVMALVGRESVRPIANYLNISSESISPCTCSYSDGSLATGSSWIAVVIHSASLIETHGISHSMQNYSNDCTS